MGAEVSFTVNENEGMEVALVATAWKPESIPEAEMFEQGAAKVDCVRVCIIRWWNDDDQYHVSCIRRQEHKGAVISGG